MFLSAFNPDVDPASHPSFFEVIAEQYFTPSLEPAVEYGWAVLAQRGRQPWVTIYNWSAELFYGSLALVDLYFVSHYDGSFSENFYGLHRVNALDGKPLSARKKYLSVVLTLGAMYARPKLPRILSSLYEGSTFLFQLLYLYRRTIYFNPILALEGVRLVRMSPDDLKRQEELSTLSRKSLLLLFPSSRLWKILCGILFAAMDGAQFILPIAVFVFRFLEWWHSDENVSLKRQKERVPPPPPPKPIKAIIPMDNQPKTCPICKELRTNAATTPSGYCCCYPCLHRYVSEHNSCPVTGIEMRVADILKIYED